METRKGVQTPTQSVILPYEHTHGDEAIEDFERGKHHLLAWQKQMIRDTLAFNDDGLFTHQKFGLAVSRRNGKSEYVIPICEWGIKNGLQIAYTAHRTSTSRSVWERLERQLYQVGYTEDELKIGRRPGEEFIKLKDTDGRVLFRTRTSNGGLGEGFDILIVDEAQEYTDDQQSALQYTVTASPNPLTIMIGTPPTTVSKGTVFSNYRKEVLSGTDGECGWAEWSVEKMTDKYDIESWYLTNPSLGYFLTERAIRAETSTDDVDFNIQRLGLWLKYNVKSAITEEEWDECLHKPSKMDVLGDISLGVKYGKDRTNVAVSVAVKLSDGRIFVESLGCHQIREGNEWILGFARGVKPAQVIIDGATDKTLADSIAELKLGKVIEPTVSEIIEANSTFEKAVFEHTICHNGQLSLREVISNCEHRSIGTRGGFGYQSLKESLDIVLMDATLLAHWGAQIYKGKKVQRVFY